jgi:uncharacterized protein (DUF302 family)
MSEPAPSEHGYVRIPSRHSVAVTGDRLESQLRAHNIIVFARIDFSADAARAGLTMRPEQLLVFGNPRAGTPLLVASPPVGLDLPLKALIWEDANGKSWVAYNEPLYLLRRHGLADTLAQNLSAVIPLIELAAGE